MFTTLIILLLLTLCSGAAAAAVSASHRNERQVHAAQTWRLIRLRNGVNSEIPFNGFDSAINAPGMVQTYPKRLSMPAAAAAYSDETVTAQALQPEESPEESQTTAPEIRWGFPKGTYSPDQDNPLAKARLRELIASGERRKTTLCWAVFGGVGGNLYAQTKPMIEEALTDA